MRGTAPGLEWLVRHAATIPTRLVVVDRNISDSEVQQMASDRLHEDMLRWLREKGHSDEEIEGILARVRQYENQVQHDSVMDSIATDSFNIGAYIDEVLRDTES